MHRRRLAIGECLKTIAQEASVALVDFLKAADCRSGIGERFGCDALRGQDAQNRVHVV
jgi:hypothetical protein